MLTVRELVRVLDLHFTVEIVREDLPPGERVLYVGRAYEAPPSVRRKVWPMAVVAMMPSRGGLHVKVQPKERRKRNA